MAHFDETSRERKRADRISRAIEECDWHYMSTGDMQYDEWLKVLGQLPTQEIVHLIMYVIRNLDNEAHEVFLQKSRYDRLVEETAKWREAIIAVANAKSDEP